MNAKLIKLLALMCGLGVSSLSPRGAAAGFLTVSGTSDIWAAGQSNASALNLVAGSGTLPPGYAFTASAGQTLAFSSVTGSVSSGGSPTQFCGPDGYTIFNGTNASTHLAAVGSISGVTSSNRGFFLVGVFTTSGTPSGAAPASPDFSSPINATTETPLINQIFYVGDGTNALGATLNIAVPVNATNFYLGFADGADSSRGYLAWNGPNGFYGDNGGSLSATFSFSSVPEPSSVAMVGLGLSVAIGLGRFRGRQKPLRSV